MSKPASTESSERTLQRREARAEQLYRSFLEKLCQRGKLSEEFAERAAVAVLACLERRIMAEEMTNLESQLPMKLQNLITQHGEPRSAEPETFGRDAFVERVGQKLGMAESEAEPIIRAVFSVVRAHVSEGEFDEVARQLPHDWADLWQLPI